MQHSVLTKERSRLKRVIVVDDHPLYRDALIATIERIASPCEIGVAGSIASLIARLEAGFDPDLVILDLNLPDASGLSGLRELRGAQKDCAVLVISARTSSETVEALMREGAAGYIPKDASVEEFCGFLLEIMRGRRFRSEDILKMWAISEPAPSDPWSHPTLAALPPQQRRVLELICEGKANKQIAYELDLALATVKAHITAILRKLGVSNRTQAVVMVDTYVKGRAAP
jgi:DNA-binding NarL/FixJ family response regulator